MSQDLDTTELFRRYYEFASRYVLRLGVPAGDVDDLVQEVFLTIHRHGGYVAGAASPKTWIARTALGVVSTFKRSRRRRPEVPAADPAAVTASPERSPSEAAETAEALDRVERALDRLELGHRAVFVLYELDGESCPDIAAGLGIPIGTVHSRLHKARKQFLEAHEALLRSEARPVSGSSNRAEASR